MHSLTRLRHGRNEGLATVRAIAPARGMLLSLVFGGVGWLTLAGLVQLLVF
jgi:hypothetical protein